MTGWEKGKGWGWIWGPDDEIGALNAITPCSILKALKIVKQGKTADLGVMVDRNSFRWPGHSATEIMSYRTPHGQRMAGQHLPGANDPHWHSTAVFICDNIGTHLDGLGHMTRGENGQTQWYNGFKEEKYAGDFGVAKAGADKFPPIIARGVLLDVAGWKGVEALPGSYAITPQDLRDTIQWEGVELRPGDVILIRTGTGRYWGEAGEDHASLSSHDTAGITLEAARWLVEEFGPIIIGSDTSTCEVIPCEETAHAYLLIEQGVPIGELHYLEGLARDRVYEFVYVATTNKLKGVAAGIAMRPIALY